MDPRLLNTNTEYDMKNVIRFNESKYYMCWYAGVPEPVLLAMRSAAEIRNYLVGEMRELEMWP